MLHPFSFIHTADLHLGAMQYGLEERRNDFSTAFAHVVDAAIKLEVDFLIIAGDLFDNPRPSSATLTDVITELNRLKKHKIPVLAVNGSHDTAQSAETSILTPLDKAELLRFLPLHGSKGWSNQECYVYGLFNYSSRLRLLQELPNFLLENPPNPEKPFNICVLHQGMEWPGIAVPYPLEILPKELPPGFQYYASGHLHRHAILRLEDHKAFFVYPGATETKDLREAEEKKGFCYVQVKSKDDVEIEHREIPTRRFVRATLECNDLKPPEIVEKALQKLAKLDCEGCIVALTLEGVLPTGFKRYQVDFNTLYLAKEKALYFQILNHLNEAHNQAVRKAQTLHPRNLHDRVLPYLQDFVADSKLHSDNSDSGAERSGYQRKAEAVWQVLEEARSRKINALDTRVADKLTELADFAPSKP
jgi:DNA repair protein SbcD/Mre11